MACVIVGLWLVGGLARGEPPAAESGRAVPARPASALEDAWSVVEPKPAPARSSKTATSSAAADARLLPRSGRHGAGAVLKPRSPQSGTTWMRTIGAMAGVVGLIVFLAWGYRAVAAGNLGLVGRARRPGVIEIVSRTALSPRQSLYLVRVGPRMVLVGQSQEGLRALDVIDDADLTAQLAGQAVSRQAGGSVAAFRECLESEAEEYDESARPRRRGGVRREPSLDELRRNVLATIERLRQSGAPGSRAG